MSRRTLTLQDVCREVGKNHVTLGQIQAGLELPSPKPGEKFTRGYAEFMKKCTALRAFGVQIGDIQDLFRKELKLLHLLHLDTLGGSATWFLDECRMNVRDPNRLLLTGFDLGFDPLDGPVQSGLDFGSREEELFASHQMGESLEHVLGLYRKQVGKIRRKVAEERPLLRRAMTWSARTLEV